MKKARENWLIKGRRENEQQEYHHKRKETYTMITINKWLCIKNAVKQVE
jgi:hypothetical protein